VKILAISGSLRHISKNSTLVRVAAKLSPQGVETTIYDGLGQVPLFNPDLDDLDNGKAPEPVVSWRAALAAADGVFICSPEYAHGVAGAFKNALDWIVGTGEFMEKPTVVFNAAPKSFHAHTALIETLRTMGARVIEGALPFTPNGPQFDENRFATDPALSGSIRSALDALVQAIQARAQEAASS
jgi:chromate reductase